MNKLIVHIGLPKTGTSSLQKFLALNNEVLHKLGYCYPDTLHDFDKEEIPAASRYNNGGFAPFVSGRQEDALGCQEVIRKELEDYHVILVDENITGNKYNVQGKTGEGYIRYLKED